MYPTGFVRPVLQDARKGSWAIENFEVDVIDAKATTMRSLIQGEKYRMIAPGNYVKLVHSRQVVMSDTPAEAWEHQEALLAQGKVLIAGLGIGFVLGTLLAKDDITDITVVEKNQEVIDLVGPYFDDPRVTIVHEDIFNYNLNQGFDFIWFDIWNDFCADNLIEMRELQARAEPTKAEFAFWGLRYTAKRSPYEFEEVFEEYHEEFLQDIEDTLITQLGECWSYVDDDFIKIDAEE